mmetsp:Transcript_109263/g.308244  ORF Transcript_109263/g.308244 Transcript_109263/m.308244 type:complete len:119 (-) Transcript_109263:1440-1796(-)
MGGTRGVGVLPRFGLGILLEPDAVAAAASIGLQTFFGLGIGLELRAGVAGPAAGVSPRFGLGVGPELGEVAEAVVALRGISSRGRAEVAAAIETPWRGPPRRLPNNGSAVAAPSTSRA